MKKYLLIFTLLASFSSLWAGFLDYDQDFSVKIEVPATDSSLVTKDQQMDKTLTALELTKLMGNGINLGNTMEAYRGYRATTTREPQYYEALWGQPLTTQELMYAYRDAGFKSIRIPVAWTNTINYERGKTEISKAYLDRVEEIVNYALNADLYVIINDHWDGQWWGMFGSADKNHRAFAVKLYKSIWTQVANRFKHYSEKVIFESANEELGSRLNDDTVFSKGKRGTLSMDTCYDATYKINQTFVDLVRETGGNNKYRFLLIAGYDTDIDKTTSTMYKMPEDKVKNRLLISVHYYTPSTYCILSEDANWGKVKNSWGTKPDYKLMDDFFKKMQKFTEQGYGVIIGEYGVAWTKQGEIKEGTELWLKNVVDLCEQYNYCPMLWDCNGLFKKDPKQKLGFIREDIAAIYKE